MYLCTVISRQIIMFHSKKQYDNYRKRKEFGGFLKSALQALPRVKRTIAWRNEVISQSCGNGLSYKRLLGQRFHACTGG